MLYGINIDDLAESSKCLPAIKALPRRATVRVVIDDGVSLSEYDAPIREIARIADVMIQVADSYDEKSLSTEEYVKKATLLMDRFKDLNCLWEVGNEINGDWLSPQIFQKVSQTLELAAGRGLTEKTAVCFFLDDSMWPYIEAHTWPRFQYALVSCYPTNEGELIDMTGQLDGDLFARLKRSTGAAETGVGEYGEDEWRGRKSIATICKIISAFERYNGGWYWNFQKNAGRKATKPWKAIADAWAMRGGYL